MADSMIERVSVDELRALMREHVTPDGYDEKHFNEAATFKDLVERFYWLAEGEGASNYALSDYS